VVEKSTAVIVYPVLTRTNYSEWSLVIRVNLQAAKLWDVINKGVSDYREDKNALPHSCVWCCKRCRLG
jgi:hypothetical protein